MTGRLLPRSDLTPDQHSQMLTLLQSHFSGVTPSQFAADLQEKSHIILLEDSGQIRGFSTLLLYTHQHQNQTLAIVYSGDTIVDRSAWGTPLLPKTWINSVLHLYSQTRAHRLLWLLITSGYRTYRFLPVFWRIFYPRFDAPTPPDTQSLLNTLAANRFGPHFNPTTGITRLPHPQILTPDLLTIPEERLSDPHIKFFQQKNPGYTNGDELTCLTELSRENLTPAGHRMIR